jgi:uncharacterized protein
MPNGLNGWLTIIGQVFGALLLVSGLCACAVPLLRASSSGDTTHVRYLLEHGHTADEAFPMIKTRALMLASASGHVETVAVLLDAGADINAQDFTGWTALHAAAFNGDYATASLLVQRGARAGETRWYRKSPVDIAAMLGHTNIVSVLEGAQRLQTNTPPQ